MSEQTRANSFQDTARGDRLRPRSWSRLYWHLTCLRKSIDQIIQDHIANKGIKCVVDFGCGNMPYRERIEPHVESYKGADLEGNPNAEVLVHSDGTIALPDCSVDLVFSSQVLEHVGDPNVYLRESLRILQPDGLLILSTHGTWRYHPDPNDYWRWTSTGLKRIVQDHGFDVIDFDAIMGPPSTGLQLFQDFTVAALPRFMKPLYCFPMQLLIQLFDRLTPKKYRLQDASVYVVVAQPAK